MMKKIWIRNSFVGYLLSVNEMLGLRLRQPFFFETSRYCLTIFEFFAIHLYVLVRVLNLVR